MPKFDIELVEIIRSKEPVAQLVIDDEKVLDTYLINLSDTTYKSEYATILKYIEYAANGNTLPEKKMRKYKGEADGVTEYEFKSKHLRLWAIQQPGKKLIIFGGFKNSQPADEKTFRALKRQYLQSIK